MLEIRPLSSPASGSWLRLPLKKTRLPAPGSCFYNYLLSQASAPAHSKKAWLPALQSRFKGFYRLWLPLKIPRSGSRLLGAFFKNFFYWLLLRIPLKNRGSNSPTLLIIWKAINVYDTSDISGAQILFSSTIIYYYLFRKDVNDDYTVNIRQPDYHYSTLPTKVDR